MAQNPYYYPGYPGQPPAGYAHHQQQGTHNHRLGIYAPSPAGYPQQPQAPGWYVPPTTETPAPPAYSAAAPEARPHFFIVSRMNRLVLTVEGASNAPGTRVIMQPRKSIENASHQMWYEDRTTGTVKNRMTDFCLDVAAGNTLVVNPYTPGKGDQQWRLSGERVDSSVDPSKCLDIAGESRSPGARVCSWQFKGGAHQKWDFEVIPPQTAPPVQYAAVQPAKPRRYFFIRSHLSGKSMDIQGDGRAPGTPVILWPRKPGKSDNQLWYQDDNGIIRSKLNDFAFDGSSGKITMQPYQPQKRPQQWTINGQLVQNATNKKRVLDVKAQNRADGAEVIPFDYHGGQNQQWAFDYV